MAERARYSPSPYHKARPSNTVGATPRPDKTVCGRPALPEYQDAADLLKAGIVHEAQLGNSELGEYHGYPMKADDHFARVVRKEWEGR